MDIKLSRSNLKYNANHYIVLLFNKADRNVFNVEAVNISLYSMFTWMHHYPAKNNDDKLITIVI